MSTLSLEEKRKASPSGPVMRSRVPVPVSGSGWFDSVCCSDFLSDGGGSLTRGFLKYSYDGTYRTIPYMVRYVSPPYGFGGRMMTTKNPFVAVFFTTFQPYSAAPSNEAIQIVIAQAATCFDKGANLNQPSSNRSTFTVVGNNKGMLCSHAPTNISYSASF
jgi:hypothetical protein